MRSKWVRCSRPCWLAINQRMQTAHMGLRRCTAARFYRVHAARHPNKSMAKPVVSTTRSNAQREPRLVPAGSRHGGNEPRMCGAWLVRERPLLMTERRVRVSNGSGRGAQGEISRGVGVIRALKAEQVIPRGSEQARQSRSEEARLSRGRGQRRTRTCGCRAPAAERHREVVVTKLPRMGARDPAAQLSVRRAPRV